MCCPSRATILTGRTAVTIDTVVLDVDGTLVDSVYARTIAWKAAFREVGVEVPSHRIHRAIGMGGDRVVAHLAGDSAEQGVGDELRRRHAEYFERLIPEISATDGAAELLAQLRERGLHVVIASSGEPQLTSRLLELVDGGPGLVHRIVWGSPTMRSKPAPDLFLAAVESVGGREAVVVGDSIWDTRAPRPPGCRASPSAPVASATTSCSSRVPSRSTRTPASCSRPQRSSADAPPTAYDAAAQPTWTRHEHPPAGLDTFEQARGARDAGLLQAPGRATTPSPRTRPTAVPTPPSAQGLHHAYRRPVPHLVGVRHRLPVVQSAPDPGVERLVLDLRQPGVGPRTQRGERRSSAVSSPKVRRITSICGDVALPCPLR